MVGTSKEGSLLLLRRQGTNKTQANEQRRRRMRTDNEM